MSKSANFGENCRLSACSELERETDPFNNQNPSNMLGFWSFTMDFHAGLNGPLGRKGGGNIKLASQSI
jgi:hypothetical protein